MKLLLSEKEIWHAYPNSPLILVKGEAIAQAQLDKIFNLDIKTTVNLIDRLRKRLDKLLEREMAK